MTLPQILSIIFSVASAIYIFIGIYALYQNSRHSTNILFFVIAMSLSIWSFGFSMSISADILSMVLFWRRFAALGFGAFFAVILHFFIDFTSHGAITFRRRFYILLYLPVFITYLGFTYFPQLNPEQYNMVYTSMGWANFAVNNIWDLFFIAYYVTYFLASLFLIWRWGKQSKSMKDKKASRMIFISFFSTIILASLTDMLGNFIFSVNIPQLAPIFAIIPAIVIYYFIRKYGLLSPKHVNEDAILMSDQIRVKVFNYISTSLIFAATVSFVARYFFSRYDELSNILLYCGTFILIAIIMQLIQKYIKQRTFKDVIIAAIFSLIIPLLTFRYYGSAGATVWAYPFAILVVSIIFDKSFVRIILSVSIILTQIVMWILVPETTVTINSAHHLIRLAIFLSAIWFAGLASRIFQSKLKENAEQMGFQKITTEISTEFISVNEQNLSRKIDTALSRLGDFITPDRIYIYIFDEDIDKDNDRDKGKDKDKLTCYGLWENDNLLDHNDIDREITFTRFPSFIKRIQVGNIITLSNISEFKPVTGDELPTLLGCTEKAFVAMPIIIKNSVFGFFGIDTKAMTKPWSDTQLDFIRIISLVFSAAFERIQQEQKIIKLAFYDHLTKLPNRFLFRDRVSQMIYLSERTNNILAVIFLTLDAFKSINDSIGHEGGDTLIIKLAEKLKQTLRKSDTIARFGGDEFLILLTNLPSTDVISNITEKILHVFDKPFVIKEQEFYVTASAGISVYPYDGKDSDSLVKNADMAMYKAKELGQNRYMYCTDDMKEEVLYKLRLTNNLFRVLDRKELRLYYQPQVDAKSHKILGAEALLRWFHPDYGIIGPDIFIPLTEQTGLIGSIGDWVLTEACRQCKVWLSKGLPDIRIAVNVSILQLKNPKFARRVKHILSETNLDAKYLELEITESSAVRSSDYIMDILHNLKDMGVTISIDDFGTEYSSLSRLSTMPIDRIKLDMHFIHGIGKSEKENAIIKSIIELTHVLGLQVIAEGVETEAQLNFLTEHNSDVIQGYYFYHPVPAEDFEEILLKN